ncbi:hypothetical protein J3R82DRAFT_11858 [Butyriboletus roseoflavus]|nr:hypothetical protein J3R82DRAFT_11858 [Butyriboletus roseoflavus]
MVPPMLRATLLGLVATVLVPTVAVQVPLGSSHRWQDEHHSATILGDEDITEWSLDKIPNPTSTDHLVFETVYLLLQHWPNTRMRNASYREAFRKVHFSTKEFPPGPEWVATDPEHFYSSAGMGSIIPSKDAGTSHSLPRDLSKSVGDSGWKWICEQSFVHVSASLNGFSEVMLCDFTSGVRVVSFANLVRGGVIRPTTPVVFEAMIVGSWHNRFPGETRIQLDLAGLVSFYDTQLASSLIAFRAGQERWDHRVGNISQEDFSAVKSRLEAFLIRPGGLSSGIDWETLFEVIVDRYSERLELTPYLLNSSATDPDKLVDLTNKTQSQLRIMLTPYLLLSATPTDESDNPAVTQMRETGLSLRFVVVHWRNK